MPMAMPQHWSYWIARDPLDLPHPRNLLRVRQSTEQQLRLINACAPQCIPCLRSSQTGQAYNFADHLSALELSLIPHNRGLAPERAIGDTHCHRKGRGFQADWASRGLALRPSRHRLRTSMGAGERRGTCSEPTACLAAFRGDPRRTMSLPPWL